MHPFLRLLLFLVLLLPLSLPLSFVICHFSFVIFLSFSFVICHFSFVIFIPFSQNNRVKYHILWMLSQIFCVLLPTNQLNLNKQE